MEHSARDWRNPVIYRKEIRIEGVVQGVGFRPFVYRSALRHQITGWVINDTRGVLVEAEGEERNLSGFIRCLREELPPLASVTGMAIRDIAVTGDDAFRIGESREGLAPTAQIAVDSHVCPDCLAELFNPADRRYRYPFINCTNCGPRYSLVTGLPYDRPKTTMASFAMCSACREEYHDPASRRFHAQPIACPLCGPLLTLVDSAGRKVAGDPVAASVALLRQGRIVAVKGLGGYHLAVDAANDGAVAELRRRKARDEKPFALMAADVQRVRRFAEVDAPEMVLLESAERPIVLLRKREAGTLSAEISPRNRYFGVMLPYTPLHYLLLDNDLIALVMTSGNLSDEPIAYTDADARARLAGIADFYLSHNRDIFIRTDDSIVRMTADRPLLLRRSRGYVPRPVFLPRPQGEVLAVGAELKNAICLTSGRQAVLSQHIGDLKNAEVFASFEGAIGHLQKILQIDPRIIAHDLHPDYYSTAYARLRDDLIRIPVQHHHAHLASCLAENGVEEEVIGVIFDGIGYGEDGCIWGGEFLVGNARGYRRAGHFRYAPMPGGDAATKEPFRMALSYLFQAFGEELPPLPFLAGIPKETVRLLRQMAEKGINSPLTSSCGRLFDAVAAMIGLRQRVSYEGQAALELEMAIAGGGETGIYSYALTQEKDVVLFDPAPLIRAIAEEVAQGADSAVISARFHNTLAAMVAEVCAELRRRTGLNIASLSGGVFQNRYLTEKVVKVLEAEGFRVLTHSQVPPNDGGLALGQAFIAGQRDVAVAV
ncbi:MAG: carbamoyltransferase HypF [Desulfuromonadaceae bacterium]|nr:carbamoyltransferase HypF [Desulfuromonadaceae bacterium]